MTLYLFR